MKKTISILSFVILVTFQGFSQTETINVAQITLKVGAGKTVELYYGFAKGDQIVFNFEEVKGKPLKEIEIIELPTNSKFMDYKVSSIVDKKIKVNKKAVYKFSFHNSSLAGRICRINIQRIPQSTEFSNFNTDWKWKTLYDTTYVPYTEDSIIGYDTTHYTVIKQRLIKDELVLQEILSNHGVKVHSRYHNYSLLRNNLGQYNEALVSISLPQTTDTKYRKTENVTWYYGIGINQELKREANKTKSNILGMVGTLSSVLAGPEMKIAFSLLDKATTDNSDLSISTGMFGDYANAQMFVNDNPSVKAIRWDNIVSSSSIRMDSPLKGKVYLGLENKNGTSLLMGGAKPVTVYVNVSVWTRIREYEDYEEKKQKITARKVTLNKTKMIVLSTQIRANAD